MKTKTVKLTDKDLKYLYHLLQHGTSYICSLGTITTELSFALQSKIKKAIEK